MIYFILFTFFFALFLVLVCYSLYQYFYLKNNKKKILCFSSVPFLSLCIGFLPSTILHIEETREENYFPSIISLPYWKTLEEINFEEWKELPFNETEMQLLYVLEPRNEVAPVLEIKVSEDHLNIENIRFWVLLKRYIGQDVDNMEMASYEAVYTKDNFFLKRMGYEKDGSTLSYCNLYDFIEMAKRISAKDLRISASGTYDIHLCYQYAKQEMDFRYQFIDVVDIENEKHRVFISDRTLWIMPVTYLEVAFIKEGYYHKNLLYFYENLEANTEIYLELIKKINEIHFPNQSEGDS